MQNLSCGYYLFFFAPFVALFVLWEMATRGLLRDWRTWRALLLLGSLVVILTLPFVLPYAAVRLHGGILREVDEVEHYSADLMSYLTADRALRLWGKTIEVFVKPEGDLFPGFLVIAVSLAAIGLAAGRIRRTLAPAHDDKRRRLATLLLLACGLLCLVIALAVIISGVGRVTFMGMDLSARSPRRSAALALVFLIAAVVVSPRLRAFLRAAWRAPDVLMAVCAALACWLSLGPRLHAFGTAYDGLGIYWLPYALVPGWDGLRVPSRYAMIAFLFAAMLVAFALSRISGRWRVVAPILLGGLFLAEATAAPVRINRALHDRGLRKVPTLVLPPPPIYERVRALPPDAVLAELPFGNPYHEVRYMFYSIGHWRRLLNGYSGGSPKSYELRASVLTRALSDPERAWLMLKEAGATHVIVHETDWHARKGQRVTEWLEAHGARRLAAFGGDVLLALPGE
jgi:hypothetical protein